MFLLLLLIALLLLQCLPLLLSAEAANSSPRKRLQPLFSRCSLLSLRLDVGCTSFRLEVYLPELLLLLLLPLLFLHLFVCSYVCMPKYLLLFLCLLNRFGGAATTRHKRLRFFNKNHLCLQMFQSTAQWSHANIEVAYPDLSDTFKLFWCWGI